MMVEPPMGGTRSCMQPLPRWLAHLTVACVVTGCSASAKPGAAPPLEARASGARQEAPPSAARPVEGPADGGAAQAPIAREDAGRSPSPEADDSTSSDSAVSTANLDPEASAWEKACTASLEKARTEIHAAGADADATPRIASQASADGTVVILLTYSSDKNKYGWLEAAATLWDHRVEQTRGWEGARFPAPLNLVRNEGRVGGTLLAMKAVPAQARKDFERLTREARQGVRRV